MIVQSIFDELISDNPDFFKGEDNDQPSMAVPNQAISAKEALARAQRNLPVPGVCDLSQLPYDGDDPDLDADSPVFNDELDVMDFQHSMIQKMRENVSSKGASEKTQAEPEPSPQSSEPTTPSK